ncbi:hypothetical protein ACFPM7_13920 [Actinokineospora guangxiensis]|uniref:GNAT family N-acetyltransferase n=1 Tax=Actinokineospora guangxiensis TaxID=1490288 RepID=A0ABW0EPA3_9PSEU
MIAPMDPAGLVSAVEDLAELLRDATDGGSSVGFLAPLPPADAKAWWLALVPAVAAGEVRL